jgi:hypothetical protein
MVALFAPFQGRSETRPLPTGVFEDDALLLRLAAPSRFATAGSRATPILLTSEDVAFEAARQAEALKWDL